MHSNSNAFMIHKSIGAIRCVGDKHCFKPKKFVSNLSMDVLMLIVHAYSRTKHLNVQFLVRTNLLV